MKKNASDQVMEYIQSKVQARIWTPGMKISTETQLQKETGFGKAAVREAVEKLVLMGILKNGRETEPMLQNMMQAHYSIS